MEIKEIMREITEELSAVMEAMDETQLDTLEKAILSANRIYVAGAGRSLMMIRGLAMRLMHMGFHSYVVGETVTPAIEPGDLLIIASGSGSTDTLTIIAQKCKKIGAELALITTMPKSPIGKMADYLVTVPAATTKAEENEHTSFQPAASTFEQSVLLIGDALIIDIISDEAESLEEKNVVLMRNHANLE